MSTETNISIKTGVNGATKNLFKGRLKPIPPGNYQPKQTEVTTKTDNSQE